MSAGSRSNRLPMVITLLLFGLAVLVLLIRWFGTGVESLTMRGVPEAPTPDADSPVTVIKTLSAQVETVREQNAQLADDNNTLRDTLQGLQQTMTQLLQRPEPKAGPDRTRLLERLQQELERLASRVGQLETTPLPTPIAMPPPVPDISVSDVSALVWIEPLDADALTSMASATALTGKNPLATLIEQAPKSQAPVSAATTQAIINRPEAKPEPVPVYTVPANSTLLDATAWTALLGRIPVGGRVPDPWRFKVLTGADNLAANGVSIPHLAGMVWSGIAVGDLALRCVSGELYSVTYVFTDGAINTVHSQGQQPLAWISDASGIPCVPGALKTNAPSFLASRMAMLALEAGAQAYADAETTRTVGPLGDSRSTVTGEAGRYALGEALSGGTREARRWLDERQRQSFDAIFVPPGTPLTLHVEQEIAIDFKPAGRRVSHVGRQTSPYRSPQLD